MMWQINSIPVSVSFFILFKYYFYSIYLLQRFHRFRDGEKEKTSSTRGSGRKKNLSQLFFDKKKNFANDWTLVITDL